MHTEHVAFAEGLVFQSAPARESGRCRDIPAPRVGLRGFNPRPLVRAGDATWLIRDVLPQAVSIRARS